MMTPEILDQFHALVKEAELLQDEISVMQRTNTKVQSSSAQFPFILWDVPVECYGSDETLKRLKNRLQTVQSKRDSIEQFIDTIEDSRVRQIFFLRYIKGCTWLQIANRMESDETADGIRMLHNRFMKRVQKQCKR